MIATEIEEPRSPSFLCPLGLTWPRRQNPLHRAGVNGKTPGDGTSRVSAAYSRQKFLNRVGDSSV
jgi:hypothetical protein